MSTIIRIKPKVTIDDLDVAVRIATEKITVIFEQRYMETTRKRETKERSVST